MTLEQLANYLVTFALVALTIYRLSVMVSHEYGPWRIFARLRGEPEERQAFPPKKNQFQELLSCPFCLSVWFALAGTPVLPYDGVVRFVVTWLALSGVAVLLVKKYG